jgi:hypothetical protein
MKEKTKQIEDIYLAACFLSYKANLDKIDRERPRHQKFIFKYSPISIFVLEDGIPSQKEVDLDEAETLFVSNRVMLHPTYPDAVRKVKSIIYA